MHTPDQTHKERLYLDINLQLMQKNLPEIKWLIVLLVKEIKKYFKSEKEEIEQSDYLFILLKRSLTICISVLLYQ